ncbi:nuclear transport factor 2 family protein [Pleomorphovibrio marinus]|uniref:nuclear transport factor 2 family protein n=1 Tax=Pleomorphovibrio marinus TaxID=2164132 RepID=UPI000E0C0D9C|nr:nuclear transport factor 2 family protein [Pleomorphovibrio marinus]
MKPKNLYFALALFLFVNLSLIAQDKAVPAVEKAVEELREAMLNGDRAKLTSLSSKKLTYGHSNGVIENQEDFVQALASGDSNFTSINLSEQSVDISGNVALVRHNLSGTTHNKGADPADVNLGILLVWQKEGKSWKLLARQAFKR